MAAAAELARRQVGSPGEANTTIPQPPFFWARSNHMAQAAAPTPLHNAIWMMIMLCLLHKELFCLQQSTCPAPPFLSVGQHVPLSPPCLAVNACRLMPIRVLVCVLCQGCLPPSGLLLVPSPQRIAAAPLPGRHIVWYRLSWSRCRSIVVILWRTCMHRSCPLFPSLRDLCVGASLRLPHLPASALHLGPLPPGIPADSTPCVPECAGLCPNVRDLFMSLAALCVCPALLHPCAVDYEGWEFL